MQDNELHELIDRYLSGDATEEEKRILMLFGRVLTPRRKKWSKPV
jgi:uncharacterized protein YukJ